MDHRLPLPRVRKPGFTFDGLPRRWLGGRLGTHAINAANLIFPAGERFFCRCIRDHLSVLEPELRRRAVALIGQEARHGVEHQAFFAELESQGLAIAPWLARYERLAYAIIEPCLSANTKLAIIAALEHMTASLALLVFERGLVDEADPRARRLLRWHAAEEIEHRDVTYDLLRAIDPRYRTRLLGFVLGVLLLNGFLADASWHLIRQEARLVGWERVLAELWRELLDPGPLRCLTRMIPATLAFLRPGFHPDAIPGRAHAEAFFAEPGWRGETASPAPRCAAVAGAGPSGMAAARALRRAGLNDLVILGHGQLSADTRLLSADRDEQRALWRLETSRGPLEVRALILGAEVLLEASIAERILGSDGATLAAARSRGSGLPGFPALFLMAGLSTPIEARARSIAEELSVLEHERSARRAGQAEASPPARSTRRRSLAGLARAILGAVDRRSRARLARLSSRGLEASKS